MLRGMAPKEVSEVRFRLSSRDHKRLKQMCLNWDMTQQEWLERVTRRELQRHAHILDLRADGLPPLKMSEYFATIRASMKGKDPEKRREALARGAHTCDLIRDELEALYGGPVPERHEMG